VLPELQERLEPQVLPAPQEPRDQGVNRVFKVYKDRPVLPVQLERKVLPGRLELRETQEQLELQVPLDQRAQRERLEQRVLVWFLRARGIAVKRTKQRTL